GTTYHFRVRGTSSAGFVTSNVIAFATLTVPEAITGNFANVSATAATLAASVNARGAATDVIFEYGFDGVSFPFSTAALPSPVAGTAPVAVSASLTGLAQGTLYRYRVRATSAAGSVAGDSGE